MTSKKFLFVFIFSIVIFSLVTSSFLYSEPLPINDTTPLHYENSNYIQNFTYAYDNVSTGNSNAAFEIEMITPHLVDPSTTYLFALYITETNYTYNLPYSSIVPIVQSLSVNMENNDYHASVTMPFAKHTNATAIYYGFYLFIDSGSPLTKNETLSVSLELRNTVEIGPYYYGIGSVTDRTHIQMAVE